MDGFRLLFSGDQLRGATDVRGCQVESVHGSQSVLFGFCARDLVDSFEIAHPFGITEEYVIAGCFHSSLVKSGFGRHFDIEECTGNKPTLRVCQNLQGTFPVRVFAPGPRNQNSGVSGVKECSKSHALPGTTPFRDFALDLTSTQRLQARRGDPVTDLSQVAAQL
jgi:hypothetical protein